jgi:hypothetical protein
MLQSVAASDGLLSSEDTTHVPSQAKLFVTGHYIARDPNTTTFLLQLLQELGLVEPDWLEAGMVAKNLNQRTSTTVNNRIGFLASLVYAALQVAHFAIPMDRHYWTGKACGYEAARTVFKALLEAGYIVQVLRPKKYRTTATYCCSPSFRHRIETHSSKLRFKRANPPLIEVRAAKVRLNGKFKRGKGLPLSTFPGDKVHQQETMMRTINTSLAGNRLLDAKGQLIDTSLTRIFSVTMTSGGRLYGDYQLRPERERLSWTIDGEPVCEIDLKASHVAIMAALYRHPTQLPQDPYRAIEWVGDDPSMRKAAKTLVQCMIHADGRHPSRFPKIDGPQSFRDKYGFGDRTVHELCPAIVDVMPFLDGSPSLTMALQFLEAEIIIDAIMRLQNLDIPAYPIHDSLLVKQSDEEKVIAVLQRVLREHLGPHAPWLDVTTAGKATRMVPPPPCPINAGYLLDDRLEHLSSWVQAEDEEGEENASDTDDVEEVMPTEEVDDGDW